MNRNISALNAIDGIFNAFKQVSIVALGQSYGLQEEFDFITALLYHPAFLENVSDIVVDFGNSLYQSVVDRFINGNIVSPADLRRVWQDTFLSITFAFQSPIYERFFYTVRAINRTLTPDRRIRVILGDPAIDWSRIHEKDDVAPIVQFQEEFFVDIVRDTVFSRGRKALIINSSSQLSRVAENTQHRSGFNITQLIERQYPKSTFIVIPHCGFYDDNDIIEDALKDLSIPSMVMLNESFIGEMEVNRYFDEDYMQLRNIQGDLIDKVRLKDIADAYLYLGPRMSLTESYQNPAVYRGDKSYLDEIDRRRKIWGMDAYPRETLFSDPEPNYRNYGC